MAQPLAVPCFSPHSMLPAAYVVHHHPLSMVPEADTITMQQQELDPLKGSLRIDECDDEDDVDVKPRPAKRSRMTFQCEECGTSYTEKRALARHRHTDQHRKKLGLPPNKKHSCSVCGKLFGRGHDLKRHYNEQHPNTPADRTTPGSSNSGEPISSGSSDYGSEHAFSANGTARSSSSPMTAATALSTSMDERCLSSSSSLPDEKPSVRHSPNSSPENHQYHGYAGAGAVRRVRTMSDLKTQPGVPVIRMDQIEEMDMSEDYNAPAISDQPHLRPSASMGSLAQRSEASSSRLSQYSTDNSIKTGTTVSVPDSHPYTPEQAIPIAELLDLSAPLKPNDDSVQPMACTMCSDAFEDDPDELLLHLRRHLEEFKGEFRCHECFIGFVHKEDLVSHLNSAANGHCGFNFPHVKPCTGHHPPSNTPWTDNIPDSDSFRLCNKLRHWEQSQLHAYVSEINNLVAARKNRKFERWSVGHIMRGSRNSFRSMAISVNTYASAPCDVDEEDKHDIGGLQQRLRQMSLKKAGTSLKSIIRKQRVPGPPSAPDPPPGTINKHLAQAISRGYLPRAERLLREFTQQTAVQHANPTLTTEALWGHSYIASRIAEHRIQENLTGTCSHCRISNAAFETGLGKIRMLVQHGADVNQGGGLCGFPICTAAWMGKADVVKHLLYKGANPDSVGITYGTPLCTAAARGDSAGSLRVVKVLLDHRADVHFRGPEGSALELARKRRELLSLEAMGMRSCRDDYLLRAACCDQIIAVLEEAVRCRTPPIMGTLYCQGESLRRGDGVGVATFKSWRGHLPGHGHGQVVGG